MCALRRRTGCPLSLSKRKHNHQVELSAHSRPGHKGLHTGNEKISCPAGGRNGRGFLKLDSGGQKRLCKNYTSGAHDKYNDYHDITNIPQQSQRSVHNLQHKGSQQPPQKCWKYEVFFATQEGSVIARVRQKEHRRIRHNTL